MITTTTKTTNEVKAYFKGLNVNYRCNQDHRGFTIYELIGQFWHTASFGCMSASSPNSEGEAWAIAYKMFNEDYQ